MVHVLKYQKYTLPLDHSSYHRCNIEEYALSNDILLQEGAHLRATKTTIYIYIYIYIYISVSTRFSTLSDT